MTHAIHLIIHGRVQGVGYRAWVCDKAFKRGLTGWVRNRVEGTVEAVFCGEHEMVELMEAHCHHGPAMANVTHIEATRWDGDIPRTFEQLPTAR